MKKAIIVVSVVFIMLLAVIGVVRSLENDLIAETRFRIHMIKLLESETLNDATERAIFSGLQTDYCQYLADRKVLFISFLLKRELNSIIIDIESLKPIMSGKYSISKQLCE